VVVGVFVACGALQLSQTQQAIAQLSVDPSSDFGTVAVGKMSLPATITVSPPSGSDSEDALTGIVYSPAGCDFTVTPQSPPTLPAPVYLTCSGSGSGSSGSTTESPAFGSGSGSCTSASAVLSAVFAPSSGGPKSCNVTFVMMSGMNPQVTLTGNGSAASLAIQVDETSLDFGQIPVMQPSGTLPIHVHNVGSSPLTIGSAMFTSNPSNAYALGPGSFMGSGLGVGSSADYNIVCTPPNVGDYPGTFTIQSNATNEPTADVALDCQGAPNTGFEVQPSPIVFAPTRVGQPPPDVPVTVTNQGSATITLTITAGASNNADFTNTSSSPQPILAGGQYQFKAKYSAAHANTGGLGSLTFSSGGNPITVNADGDALTTSMDLSVSAVDFGTVCAGGSVAPKTVDIYAGDQGAFTIEQVTQPAQPFSSTASAPETLMGSHGNDYSFTVAIAGSAAGSDYSSSMEIDTDIPGSQPDVTIPIHANVLPSGAEGASPSSVDFGPMKIDSTSSGKQVTFTNCGTGPLDVTSAEIVGPNASEFAIILPAAIAMTLQPGQSETFTLAMTPRTTGQKSATLDIDYAGGLTGVALQGDGFGSDSGGTKPRETYYACGAGRPVALWPIALALLALVRRRR